MSSNGWDVAGATWFGYTTFWINRAGLPAEELGATPRGTGRGMADLVGFVESGCPQHPFPAPLKRPNRTRHGPGT